MPPNARTRGDCGALDRATFGAVDYIEFVEGVLAHYLDSGMADKPWVTVKSLSQDLGLTQAQIRPALDDLSTMGMLELDTVIRPNSNTDTLRHGSTLRSAWPQIFRKFVTPDQEKFLIKLVEMSERRGTADAEMEMTNVSDLYDALGWESLEDPDARRVCDALDHHGFLVQWAGLNYHQIDVRACYAGVVRATQKAASEWQQKLQELLAGGETTTVDVKQELALGSERQNAEFVRDVLGLGTTKASGVERYMVIGFDDDTLELVQSVDTELMRDHLEDVLNAYAYPRPDIDWITVSVAGGTAGIVVTRRDPTKIPYRISRDVWKLKKDAVYVRHGTHTEAPTPDELKALELEGEHARSG